MNAFCTKSGTSASGTQIRRLPGLEHVGKILALGVAHLAHGRQLLVLQLRRIGQIGSRIVEKVDDLAEIDHGFVDALVLAELVVGGVEVGKIDAVKDCRVGADRLRVVKRGGDQIVDIDRFDVEGLAHMGAAVAQDLHHLQPDRSPDRSAFSPPAAGS